MVSHAAAVNTLLDLNRRYAIGADDRVLALSALNFDLSVYDIFGSLAAGGGIVMPDAGRERDAEHWLARMIRDGVTIWNSVPALLQMLLTVGGESLAQAAPRLVWLSGDWIPPGVPGQVRACWPESRLVSMGGATDAAIWSIGWEVPKTGLPAGWSSVPYGTALGNQQVWVLDAHLNPCPQWVSGEIYLGGKGLAHGYWHDAERSARQFIVHPHSGERLYRTGDRGRWRPEGWVEFQGRDDGQVKIRGHRIELGEIEQVLRRCPGIDDCLVGIRDGHGARELAAYVIGEVERQHGIRWLTQRLPRYMVPVFWIPLARWPLTPNSKVDARALAQQEAPLPPAHAAAPRGTPLQQQLATWIAQTFHVASPGPQDNFFDVGLNSLDIVMLFRHLQQRFPAANLTLTELFEHKRIDALAQRLTGRGHDTTDASLSSAEARAAQRLQRRALRTR